MADHKKSHYTIKKFARVFSVRWETGACDASVDNHNTKFKTWELNFKNMLREDLGGGEPTPK